MYEDNICAVLPFYNIITMTSTQPTFHFPLLPFVFSITVAQDLPSRAVIGFCENPFNCIVIFRGSTFKVKFHVAVVPEFNLHRGNKVVIRFDDDRLEGWNEPRQKARAQTGPNLQKWILRKERYTFWSIFTKSIIILLFTFYVWPCEVYRSYARYALHFSVGNGRRHFYSQLLDYIVWSVVVRPYVFASSQLVVSWWVRSMALIYYHWR